jgi:sigma-B regulation protein RsbU (phosphoserine phosphatase)
VHLASRPVGVLLCDNLDEPGRLGAAHLRLMEFAAEALSHVFQRHDMRRLETAQAHAAQEFLAARRVQEQIFTKDISALQGPLRWSVLYQPALALGGDFYDVNQDAAGTTWVVADVSGKGVPAALVVSLLKAFCKCLYPRNLSPRLLLLELDQLLRGEIPATMFLTIVVIHVDQAGTMVSSAVGHPPILVARRDGRIEALEGTQGMLCMWPHALLEERITERRSSLEEGDRVFLFTDGLIEAMDPSGALYELERVAAQLAATRTAAPDACLRRILDDVVAFAAGATWNDDITMVIGGR